MRLVIITSACCVMIAWAPVAAAGLKLGWLVQYQQEAFSGAVFATAYANEVTQDFQKAGLAYTCGDEGQPVFLFFPRGFGFEQGVDVEFRGIDGALHFSVAKLTTVGSARVLEAGEPTAALRDLLVSASEDVPYRFKDVTGLFPVVGVVPAITTIEAACPAPTQ